MIDVFPSATPQSGNPLAVVLDADGFATEQMAAFSVWTNLSECTFVLPPADTAADYRVRIFSLTTEQPFAGHPTLGTARAWLDTGGVSRTPGRVIQECGVGLVTVRTDDDTLAFAAPPPIRSGTVADGDLAVAPSVLGVTPADVVAAEWINNGTGVENAGFHIMGVAQDEGTDGPAFVGDGRDQFVRSGRGRQITDVVHIVEVTGRNVPTVGDETRHDPRGDAVASRGTGDQSHWHVANGTRPQPRPRSQQPGSSPVDTMPSGRPQADVRRSTCP